MFRRYAFRVSTALFVFALFAAPVLAQISTKPLSNVGGYAGNEMRKIYAQGIGRGYTADSLNNMALRSAQARVGNVGQSTSTSPSGPGLSSGSFAPGRSSKPFSQLPSSPTVSPYLNLFRDDLDGSGDFNYQTLVRPQLNQLQLNQQFQNQNTELNRRVQSISAQRDYANPAGSETMYPTGHQTVFGYHSRYYPGIRAVRGKAQ